MSSGFISEAELAEARQKRQEEWERVRKPDDPIVRPEEPYDHRSLYERLQEQKQKKDLEYEEAHKLKNMIKGLDDDEIEFLDLVDRTKIAADRKKELEEEIELNDYRNRVATLQEKSLEERLQAEIAVNKPKAPTSKTSQQKLLKGVVVKKRKNSEAKEEKDEAKHRKIEDEKTEVVADSALKCVGILPGLGCYNESTSDENSSDSEVETTSAKIDILGRKITKKEKET
ncbi:PSME3-interacting protein [Tribolium castaneum]|uniref:Protein FAM192A-like Protein n=1 Tax=Tribolium castaneum TaxID=7070 RepID=D6WTB2_TRICA|nr:PREDICTED: protein FAM192A [Tribolium castaneum]EFA06689.1 Protein FAM192A-like Protein [Tribolium castaneum]|eukprot:XP_972180.1 PREDICTED: protein FAM192A [Tribolium castaneum]